MSRTIPPVLRLGPPAKEVKVIDGETVKIIPLKRRFVRLVRPAHASTPKFCQTDSLKRKNVSNDENLIGVKKIKIEENIEDTPLLERISPKMSKIQARFPQIKPKILKMEPKFAHKQLTEIARMEPKCLKLEPKTVQIRPKVPNVEPKTAQIQPKVPKVEPKIASQAFCKKLMVPNNENIVTKTLFSSEDLFEVTATDGRTGKGCKIVLNVYYTTASIERKLRGTLGLTEVPILNIFLGTFLGRGQLLKDVQIPQEIVYLVTYTTQMFVKLPTSKTISVQIASTDLVEDIKWLICQKEGIPPKVQRLIYAGMRLEDGMMAASYNLEKGSTMHLMLELVGC